MTECPDSSRPFPLRTRASKFSIWNPPTIELIGGHSLCPSIINEAPVVIDLGANRGEFTRAVIERFNAKVHAVEASPGLCSMLPHCPGCLCYNFAISGSCGREAFHLSSNSEANSRFKLHGFEYTHSIQVDAITLESLMAAGNISDADILKVDIEGSEIDMFASTADETIKKFQQITVEFHEWLEFGSATEVRKIIKRLKRLGFYHFTLVRGSFADVLFLSQREISLAQYYSMLLAVWVPRILAHLRKRLSLFSQ